ncbi:DNA-binding transcriptional regulator, MerR family [Actinopolyspora alba]|uniref:DNA-binding transcriptional regulator, MerR family n=1 Tax=Actinopolyspora alba TaxID=673379 RepID=A0A1I1WTF2_9ACTN|nr:MerR family transcriptional regulator [Actinopolyspora alba]SFD98474.1 DNA-binding transcriptional regulator, MerR family [Actinopolyspora alba]
MDDNSESGSEAYTTRRLAAAVGYSVQQVRDLERLHVIPPALRRPNGYRQFTALHLTALRAYRDLAIAVGPVAARFTMREISDLPYDEAVARIVTLHVDLARSRDNTVAALHALDSIVDEGAYEDAPVPGDSMTITELAVAIGVRSSTLRFWEQQGLIVPERAARARTGKRYYPPDAIRDARIVAALRAGGYRIPAVRAVMTSLYSIDGSEDARDALQNRLRTIAARSEALLRAGTDIADLLSRSAAENP